MAEEHLTPYPLLLAVKVLIHNSVKGCLETSFKFGSLESSADSS